MTRHLLTILFTVLTFLVTSAPAQDTSKAVALLIPLNRPKPDAALFPDNGPVTVIPLAVAPARNPWELLPATQSPSIRIKERFVPVTRPTTCAPAPSITVSRWELRKAIRSLDLARRYAPVYGTGPGVK